MSCHKPTPVVYVNDNKIEEVNEFGYHGDPLSHKENNDGLFKRRITKVYGKNYCYKRSVQRSMYETV